MRKNFTGRDGRVVCAVRTARTVQNLPRRATARDGKGADFTRKRRAPAPGQNPPPVERRLCVAPMMERTDRHFRRLLRFITGRALLYTEMVPAGAMLHGDRGRMLGFEPAEKPLALQVGGSDPEELRRCALLALEWNYDEINLNLGCPSARVRSGGFGACLMAEPARVADCVAAMAAGGLPMTVKIRTGIGGEGGEGEGARRHLDEFVAQVAAAGCRCFIVHARKAVLGGLSPRANRNVPPLEYARVYQLKCDFPRLQIIINGGIVDSAGAARHLGQVDGVMIGREACRRPLWLGQLQKEIFGEPPAITDVDTLLDCYAPYMEKKLREGARLRQFTRHLAALFHGRPGAAQWRRALGGAGEGGMETVRKARRAMALVEARRAA